MEAMIERLYAQHPAKGLEHKGRPKPVKMVFRTENGQQIANLEPLPVKDPQESTEFLVGILLMLRIILQVLFVAHWEKWFNHASNTLLCSVSYTSDAEMHRPSPDSLSRTSTCNRWSSQRSTADQMLSKRLWKLLRNCTQGSQLGSR